MTIAIGETVVTNDFAVVAGAVRLMCQLSDSLPQQITVFSLRSWIMGQMANSGRNASLDEQKQRAAGRRGRTGQASPERQQIKDPAAAEPAKGKTAGAFGRDGRANRRGGVGTRGGGGGGGESSTAKANHLNTGTSKRTARKRA